jgi:hypothetical protein
MLPRSVLAAVMVLIAVVGSTNAAFASRLEIEGDRLVYRADKGERNEIRISGGVDTYVVRDTGATIRVVAPCELVEPSQNVPAHASCPAAGLTSLGVDARDANDSVSIDDAALPALVVGGSGDDRLAGGTGPDRIDGSEGADLLMGRSGNDALAGGAGADDLRGGPGDDTVLGGPGDDSMATDPGADSFDGGPGLFDVVSYGDRLAPVSVVVDGQANDGERGEGDNVQATMERIRGGRANDFISAGASSSPGMVLEGEAGDDVLVGGLGADDVRGGPGSDRIGGGAGSDVLTGGDGSDAIVGDAGNDLVDAADGAKDTIDCGAGSTDSASLDRSDTGARGCEKYVPGRTPGGVSQTAVAGFWRFSGAKLRSRGGRHIVEFNADIPRDSERRKQKVLIRVTFRNAGWRRLGRPTSCEVLIDTRTRTKIVLRRVPRNARTVKVAVETEPPPLTRGRPMCRNLR